MPIVQVLFFIKQNILSIKTLYQNDSDLTLNYRQHHPNKSKHNWFHDEAVISANLANKNPESNGRDGIF